MQIGDTESIELLLNRSISTAELMTQLIELGDFVTSTSDPNALLTANGQSVEVESSIIETTSRMKVEIKPQDTSAFSIKEMHDNAEQVVSLSNTTQWRWSITALKEGPQVLEIQSLIG